MWVLIQEPKGGGTIKSYECGLARWALPPGSRLIVGREGADIEGVVKDVNVSKRHATITVGEHVPGGRPEVMLEDTNSSWGTFLNENILTESQRLNVTKSSGKVGVTIDKPMRLKDNDRIRFGVMYSFYRLRWVTFSVTSSMLKTKAAVEEWLEQLAPGNRLQSQWTRTTTHLVMTSISLSLKVVNCLASGVPIVTPEYFRDFVMAASSKQMLPVTSAYTPFVTDTQSESQLREPGISFKVNLKRARLFSSLTFVFQTEKELEAIALPIQLAGGKSRLWSPDDDLESISQPGVVAVQPHSSIRSSQSQAASEWKRVSSHLASNNLATSPATHIYLAIVHCSTATFCNPRRQTSSELLQQPPTVVEGKVTAPETQQGSASPFVKPTSTAGVKPISSRNISGASRAPDSSVSTLLSNGNESQTLMGQDSASPFIKPTPGVRVKPTSSTNIRTLSSGVSRAAEASLTTSTMSSAAQSTIFSLKTQPTPAAQPNPLQGAAPPLFSSTSTAAECMEVIDLDQDESQEVEAQAPSLEDNLSTSVPSRKRIRDDETVDTRSAKKGRGETQGKENRADGSNSENSAGSSGQMLDLRVTGFEESCKSSSLEGKQRQQPGHNVNNIKQKSADMFDTSPMKSTLATQTKDSTIQLQSAKRSTAIDDEDVFGFGDQPAGGCIKDARQSTAASLCPASRKRDADEEEDDIFGFSPVKKAVPSSRPTQRSQLNGSTPASSNIALVHSPLKTSSLISEKVTPGKKGVIMDTSVIFQGFIGKGEISFKPKVEKEEGDEYSQLSKSLCKVTLNFSLLRTSQPRPSYVPAPEPELLGRPTPNYKNFKKQQIGRSPDSRVRVPLGRYTATKNQPGVEEWLAENPDISRVEAEEDTRHKQEDGFWDFLNSQEVKNTGRKRR